MSNPIRIEKNLERLKKVEDILQYTFNDKSLLLQALTHPSAVQGNSLKYSYERFEFLGDSLLNAIVSIAVFRKYVNMDEGKMTHMRVALVSGEHLSKVSDSLGLSDLIIFGSSEENTGKRGMKSALENVFEAIVAAIFLDGGQIRCWEFVTATIIEDSIDNDKLAIQDNPKSALQEKVQVNHNTPTYEIIAESGPAHARKFIAEVSVDGKALAQGEGKSKKEAEANAALAAIVFWDKEN